MRLGKSALPLVLGAVHARAHVCVAALLDVQYAFALENRIGLIGFRVVFFGITLAIALKTAIISEFILKSLVLLLSEPFEAAWELE